MSKIAANIAARTESLIAGAESGDSPDVESVVVEDPPEPAPEPEEPKTGVRKKGPVKAPVKAPPPADVPQPDEAKTRLSILEEKLAAAQAKRAAREADKQERQARSSRTRQQIQQELAAAQQERKAWENHRQGSYKEALIAQGRDPVQVFKEMQQEAMEANTPEGKVRLLERTLNEKFDTVVKPLTDKIQALEDELKRSAESTVTTRFQADFVRQIQDPEFDVLCEAYDDEDIMAYADDFRRNPDKMYAAAKQFDIQLTDPRKGFTMREILSVLKAAQVAHDEGRKARRDKRLSSRGAGQQKPATVNGTSAPRNAGSTIDNDLASSRVSGGGRTKLSRAERIEAEIARLENR